MSFKTKETLLSVMSKLGPLGKFLSKKQEWLDARESEIDPCGYGPSDVHSFRQDLQAVSLISKLRLNGETSSKTRAEAVRRFELAEEMCLHTNRRLRSGKWVDQYARQVCRAQQIISDVLGPFSLSKVLQGCGFGPGACVGINRECATPSKKLDLPLLCPKTGIRWASLLLAHDPHWAFAILGEIPSGPWTPYRCFEACDFAKLSFVPKNAKTDRSIGIEPSMGIYLQKGVGAYIRRRLFAFGINLDDQTANQNAAVEGSLSGHLATIDLSMASDTVSRGVVELLLEPQWVEYLYDIRTKGVTTPDGHTIMFEKFSSMGNGFTFELETLIFYALARAVAEENPKSRGGYVNPLVYGDDIIVHSSVAPELIEMLQMFGFKPNTSKTFYDGFYRESCGVHAYFGEIVTPQYVRVDPTKTSELIHLHNLFCKIEDNLGINLHAEKRKIRELTPFFVPYGFDNSGCWYRSAEREWVTTKNGSVRCLRLIPQTRLSSVANWAGEYAYYLSRWGSGLSDRVVPSNQFKPKWSFIYPFQNPVGQLQSFIDRTLVRE